MKQFVRTRWGKAVLAAVFALACFLTVLAGTTALGAAQNECYTPGVQSYYDTKDYQYTCERQANNLMDEYAQGGLSRDPYRYEADYTNFRFRIATVERDGSLGPFVADTFDGVQTQFGAWYLFVVLDDGSTVSRVMSPSYGKALNVSATGQSYEEAELLRSLRCEAIDWLALRAAATQGDAALLELPATVQIYQLELRVTDPITIAADYYGGLKDGAELFALLYGLRCDALVLLAVAGLLALASLIALFAGTGRRPGSGEVFFGWFDRVPMELSLAVLGGVNLLLWVLALDTGGNVVYDLFFWVEFSEPAKLIVAICGVAALTTVTVCSAAAWLLALARAAKSGRPFRGFFAARVLGWLAQGVKWLWGAFRAAPLVPRTALLLAGFAGVNLLAVAAVRRHSYIRMNLPGAVVVLAAALAWLAAAGGLIYAVLQMKTLDDCARRIAKGDYRVQVDTRRMAAPLADHAKTLQNIAAGLNDAVAERTKSERMKTELITNVSHDLKTPLTSIINYTDLLQSQPLPPKAAEYAAVLARESARLKKLTEDLVEASKASSGAMNCEKQPTDLAELCTQALGEYAARLEAAGLAPVLAMPPQGLWANADGRLVWRTLDNLLSNACKYAMPGTRLYLTGSTAGDTALLELKNISREPLNLTAEELMERFARGDASRSSEGSGLGLSIAQSLCELQGGSFELTVDGDLFKAQVGLPRCAAPAEPAEPEQLLQATVPTQTTE